MEREPHEFDDRDPGAAGGAPAEGPEPPTDEALDVEAPNESAAGHHPAPDGPTTGGGEPTDPDGGTTRP